MLNLKTSGFFLICAGALLLTRLIPIFANLPEGFTTFPPATIEDMAILAAHNSVGYHYSHLMALFAMPLLLLGYIPQLQRFNNNGMTRRALTGGVCLTFAAVLFSVALMIDGFAVPLAASEYVAPGLVTANTALYLTEFSHQLALAFFYPSSIFFSIAIALIASPIAHGQIHNRWYGYIGLFLGYTGILGYFFGWKLGGMEIGASVMMAFFMWSLLLGFSSLYVHKNGAEQ